MEPISKTINGLIEQLRHEFWFGAALSSRAFSGRMSDEDQRKYEETFLANFNAAVTENALKWHSMELRQGEVNYRTVDAILTWMDKHEIPWPKPIATFSSKEWWTNSKVKTDMDGQCRIRAFYGKYAVTCGAQTKEVLLSEKKGQVTVCFD